MLLLLLLQLGAVPMPDPPPSPFVAILAQQTYDIHANDGPDAATDFTCWRLESDEAHKVHHCACELKCYGDTAREEPWDAVALTGCRNYCAPERHPPKCRCHSDESCVEPKIEEPKK